MTLIDTSAWCETTRPKPDPGLVGARTGMRRRMEAERGLDKQDLPSQCLKHGEEVGELYRAVRSSQVSPQDPGGRIADVGDEAGR